MANSSGDYMGRQQEKHWWLALLVNPRGPCPKTGPLQEAVQVPRAAELEFPWRKVEFEWIHKDP